MPKAKYVYQDLLERQTRVTNIVGSAVVAFFGVIYLVSKFVFDLVHPLVNINLVFLIASVINLLLYRYHKKIYLTYRFLIMKTFAIVLILSWYSGGLMSPAIFILSIIPIAAFSTSKKQGAFWSVLVFMSIIFMIFSESSLPESIISQDIVLWFTAIIILFTFSMIVLISYLVNESAFSTHRKLDRDRKQLEDKSARLENLTTLLNYSNDLMCILDQAELTIDDTNPVFKLHLGYEISEIRASKLMNFIKPDENTDQLEKDLKSLKEDHVHEFSCTLLSKSKEEFVFDWVAIAKNGKVHASARMNKTK